jgi:hypothetical protein
VVSDHGGQSGQTELEPSETGGGAFGEGGRLFAAVSGSAALVVLLAGFAPWIRFARYPEAPYEALEVRPWLDNVGAGMPTGVGASLVVAAVFVFIRVQGHPFLRLALALFIASMGIALAVFSYGVYDHHLTRVVPNHLANRVPECAGSYLEPPCISAVSAGGLEAVFWSGRAIGLFGVMAALRHRSSRASRWSDAKFLAAAMVIIVVVAIALGILLLVLVSQMGH